MCARTHSESIPTHWESIYDSALREQDWIGGMGSAHTLIGRDRRLHILRTDVIVNPKDGLDFPSVRPHHQPIVNQSVYQSIYHVKSVCTHID